MHQLASHLSLLACLAAGTPAVLAQTTVFASDFDGTLPAEITPGLAQLEGVQGYAGLGPVGDQFGGTFLRSPTGNVVTLQLAGLPPHNSIGLDFLFAAIDSLDGTGTFPGGDFFAIRIDGNTFFRESFANAMPSQIQSYQAPPGVTLARMVDLGFSGPGSFYTDSAYWFGADPQFAHIGHTASSLLITFEIEGPGIQPLADESWAMDNLRVTVDTVTLPGSVTAYGASCGPSLSVFGNPLVGQSLSIFVQDLPANTVVAGLAIGLSNQTAGGVPLPVALDFLGATGCFLHHDVAIEVGRLMFLQSTAATDSIPVPNVPGFAGFAFFLQAWGVAPGVNPLGLVATNGVRVELGQ